MSGRVMLCVLALAFVPGAAAAQADETLIEKLRENLYVVTTGGPIRTNITFFITENHGVVMFETGDPGWGKAWLKALARITDKPLTTLVVSHTHSDHTGSMPELGPIPVRITHENVKKSLQETECAALSACQLFQGDSAKYLPNRTYQGRLTLFEGNDRIELYNFGRSHTNADTIAVIPALNTLVMADMFAWRGVPRVYVDDGGSALNFPAVMTSLMSMVKDIDTVITGHSLVMKWADMVEFGNYVVDYSDYIREMHESGRSVAEAMNGLPARLARYKPCAPSVTGAAELRTVDCRFRTDQAARNATIMYDELEGRVSTFGSEKPRR